MIWWLVDTGGYTVMQERVDKHWVKTHIGVKPVNIFHYYFGTKIKKHLGNEKNYVESEIYI